MTIKLKLLYPMIALGLFACKARQLQNPVSNQQMNQENEYPVRFDALYLKTLNEVVPILQPYESTPNPHFQRRIYDTYYRVGASDASVSNRKKMIKLLLNSCGDSLNTSYACDNSLQNLHKVNKREFDAADIGKIQNLLTKDYNAYYPQPIDYAPYGSLVLLTGFLDMESAIPKLKSLISPDSHYERKWEVHLALARLGEKEAIDYCLEEIKQSPAELRKLAEVSYIRQPEMIEVFNKYLFSDAWMQMPESEKEGSATVNFILNLYAASIKKFPLDFSHFGFTKEDIMTARKWVEAHKGNYEMNRDTF